MGKKRKAWEDGYAVGHKAGAIAGFRMGNRQFVFMPSKVMIDAGVEALSERYQDLVAPDIKLFPEIVLSIWQAMAIAKPDPTEEK